MHDRREKKTELKFVCQERKMLGNRPILLIICILVSSKGKALSLFTVQSLSVLLKNEIPSSCRPSISRTWASA